jgi:hypothetical protein
MSISHRSTSIYAQILLTRGKMMGFLGLFQQAVYFDAPNVDANASLDSLTPHFAVEVHLEQLFAEKRGKEDRKTPEDPASEEQASPLLPTALSEARMRLPHNFGEDH